MNAFKTHEPIIVLTYLFEMVHVLSSSYEVLKIMKSKWKVIKAKLAFYKLVRVVLNNDIRLLELSPVEKYVSP